MPFYETYEERRERRARQLEEAKRLFHENFPANYLMYHSIALGAMSILFIAIQIVLLASKSYMAEIANGIWSSLISFIAIFTALLLYKQRTIKIAVVAWSFHLFSYVVSLIAGLLFVVPITQSKRRSDVNLGWDIAGFIVGILSAFIAIWFIIYLPCRQLCKIRT